MLGVSARRVVCLWRVLPLALLGVLLWRAIRVEGDFLLAVNPDRGSLVAWTHLKGLTVGWLDARRDDQPPVAWHTWEPEIAAMMPRYLNDAAPWERYGLGLTIEDHPQTKKQGITSPAFCLVTLPVWLLATLASLPLYGPVFRWRQTRNRRQAGLCPRCGYDLRASAGRCPDCGTRFDANS